MLTRTFTIEFHRDKKKSQEDEGYTKIQITIEKDRSNLEKRQRKLEYWRNFETGREARNQQRKHDRIDAMKERKTDYPQLKEENARQVHVVSFFSFFLNVCSPVNGHPKKTDGF